MEYVKLGNSEMEVSRLCVGCMSFGDPASKMHEWTLNTQESEQIIKHALGLRINFFDTANCYSAESLEAKLQLDEIKYLEEAYVPHNIVGAV